MEYAKIIVKNNYEKRGDLVLRSYIRALKKIGKIGELLLNDDEGIIFGVVDLDGNFHEIFTNNIIDYNGHSSLTNIEYNNLCKIFVDLSDEDVSLLQKIMESVLFDKKRDLGFDVSTMEELSSDCYIEFDAYNNYLSRINPFPKLGSNDDMRLAFAFNILSFKIKAIKEMQKMDTKDSYDNYDINNYENLNQKRKVYKRK